MITDFTDREPTLSAVIIAALFTVVPAAFMLTASALSGGDFNSAKIIIVYALLIQLILWLNVQRPILTMMPFIIMVAGFIFSEIFYTVSMSMNPPGVGPSASAYYISSVIVTLFGAEAAGIIAALIVYIAIVVVRKIWELIVYR